MKRHALTALALVAAFVIGRLTLAADSSATHTERVVERQPIERRIVQTSSSSTSSLTADEVRSIVNEALAAREPAAEPPKPVDTAVLSQAQAVVATSIASGRWTAADREQLRAVMDHLSKDQMREVMTSLARAINDGRVKLETDGSPV
ncbi:MAG TPA: hypothetical protein VIV11_40490 [Kofleriaceae bacterium]